MNATFLKKALPHIIAIAVFLIVAVIYSRPALEGKVLGQSDVQQWKGMAQQSFEYKEKHGHFPLWTESAFSGMPAYTIAIDGQTVLTYGWLVRIMTLGLPQPISFFFLACVCFYILMVVLRINPWIAVLASLAYAYCSYDPIVIVTGHVTKMWAMAYAPAVIAPLLMLFRRQYLWGTGLLALFFASQVGTQHLQIVYYTVLSMGLLTLFYFIDGVRQGKWKETLIPIGLAIIGAGIGFGTSVGDTLPLEEYAKETMRGGRTELTTGANSQETSTGLSKDYAFMWSYGIGETLTLAVPDLYGAGSGAAEIGDNSKLADKMAQELNVPEDTGLQFANGYAYWGAQPGTSGAVYIGAVICFLCIFGFVILKGWYRWWLLSVIGLGILLAWGHNFSAFNYFMFDYFPYYNKFRAPSTALFMPQLAAPILVALGLNQLVNGKEDAAVLWKKFKTACFATGGLLVVLVGFYFTASYGGGEDARLKDRFMQIKMQQLSQAHQTGPDAQAQAAATAGVLMKALEEDRQSIAGSDLLRTIILIAIAGALVGLFIRKKIKPVILLAGLLLLSSYDLLGVSSRYLNADRYADPGDTETASVPTAADQQINSDPDKNFRVIDQGSGSDPFQDAHASYYHNSLGGYSPGTRLGLYEDLMEKQLRKGNMQVYNMLNTKYFIQQDQRTGQPVVRQNPAAFGPCWLVKAIHYVKNGDEEMQALDSVNVRDTAIIQQRFASRIKFMPVPDSTATLHLVMNDNDKIDYKFSSHSNQFAVFSEIYYDKGWNVYLDGNKADYIRVDYVLRGMEVPAGDHTIEFRFEPHSYQLGTMLTSWFSLLIYILLIAGVVSDWNKRKAGKTAKA